MTTTATPRQVFDLVDSLLSDTWPVLDQDAATLLERHSCDVLLAHRNRERAVRVGRWHCPELDVWGAWTTCPPHGIGLNVYLLDTTATGPTISPGYGALIDEFTSRLGAPEIIDRNPHSPHTMWSRNHLTVSVDSYTQEQQCPQIKLTIQPAATALPSEVNNAPHHPDSHHGN